MDTIKDKLYEKLVEEQENYRGWLLSQPQEEVINHCYEYCMREDILMALEYMDLNDDCAKALLDKGITLASLYDDFLNIETDHMDIMRDAVIEGRANKILQAKGMERHEV